MARTTNQLIAEFARILDRPTADIVYASGAVHDDLGPITSFAAITPAGQAWIHECAIGGSYVIEDEQVALTLGCIEAAGLVAKAV